MDVQEQLKNATILIAQLNEENEALKKKVVDTELELSLYKKEYDDSFSKVKELIEKCGISAKEYQEAIDSLRDAKKKYHEATKEIYMIKRKYQKEVEKIINQIS